MILQTRASKLQNVGYYGNTEESLFFSSKHDILCHMIDDKVFIQYKKRS